MSITTLTRLLVCSLLLLLAGCGTTTLTDAWQAPAFHRGNMENVMVVGMTNNKTNRILFERGFVNALTAKGINASASYEVIGSDMPTKEALKRYLASSNKKIDHVIVTHYGGKETTTERVPESVRTYYTGPYYPTYGGYWDRYGNTQTMTRESYIDTRTNVILTTSIYDVKTEQLQWVGRSKSFEVGSVSAASKELAQKIVAEIGK
jgi:hypothetical protein